MARLSMIRLYRDEDVPDFIVQEVRDLVEKMSKKLVDVFNGHDPNIVLSALNRFHSATIITLITEAGLEEAAKTEALGLLKNIEHMAGISISIN